MHFHHIVTRSIACAALCVAGLAAPAQAATAPAPAAPAASATTPATAPATDQNAQAQLANANLSVNEPFGDWTVRCFQIKSVAPCDVLQVASNKDTKQRVLLVSIAYVPSRDSYAIQLVVPLGVTLARGLTLDAGDKSLAGVHFTRCERDGCYVETPLQADTVQALSTHGKATTITLTAYGKNDLVKLPLSLNGFAQAIAKMKGYARDKAVANPPPQ